MIVRPVEPGDRVTLITLIAGFRVELARLKGVHREPDPVAAAVELDGYRPPRFRIFVAETDDGGCSGYLVCRVDDNVVWAESLHVEPAERRRGIGSALYAEAERLARDLDGDTVYNWVHPNNDPVIAFLGRRGYDVLNLIEIRGRRPGETTETAMQVGKHEFRY